MHLLSILEDCARSAQDDQCGSELPRFVDVSGEDTVLVGTSGDGPGSRCKGVNRMRLFASLLNRRSLSISCFIVMSAKQVRSAQRSRPNLVATGFALLLIAMGLLVGCTPAAPVASTPVPTTAPAPKPTEVPKPAAGTTPPAATSAPTTVPAAAPTAAPAAAKPGAALDVVTFAGVANFVAYGPLVIAQQKGYMREQGIESKYADLREIGDTIVALTTGAVDVGADTYTAGNFNAIDRNTGIRYTLPLSIIVDGNANSFLVLRNELKDSVKTPADLKGKKIAICALNSACEFQVELLLQQGGLTTKDVDLVPLAFGDVAAALQNGAVDAGVLIEPLVTAGAEKNLFIRWMSFGKVYPKDYIGSMLLYGGKFRTERKDVAERFTVAYLKGLRDWYDAFIQKGPNRKEIIDLMAANTDIKDPAMYDKMDAGGGISLANPDGQPNTVGLGLVHDFLAKKALLEKPDNPHSGYIDSSFGEFALAKLGKYVPPAQRR